MAALTGVDFSADDGHGRRDRARRHHWDNVTTREAELTYNPTTLARLEADAPGFAWRAWAAAIQLPAEAEDLLIACEPSFLTEFARLWSELPLEQWKQWLRWRIVASAPPTSPREISRANFEFYGTVLSGATEQRDRWKRGVQFVESVAGEVGWRRSTSRRHFPPANKEHMDRLVATLVEAYGQAISRARVDDRRRPSRRRSPSSRSSRPRSATRTSGATTAPSPRTRPTSSATCARRPRFEEDWEWAKIGKPVDRSEWLMTPQTVNAYYLPVANEIVFPAAILQAPFFHPEADDAVNFGGIVSVIGHEVGHGFDDQGSKYDGTGKLDDWWTEADREAFMERAGQAHRAVRRLLPRAVGRRAHGQRRAHGGREHRRPRGRRRSRCAPTRSRWAARSPTPP